MNSLAAVRARISAGLGLDSWQRDIAAASMTAELACALTIPEMTASTLLHESMILVHDRPNTLQALTTVDVSYRHAQVIIDEVGSPNAAIDPAIPPAVARDFEARLLAAAPGLTVAKLRTKARRWREREHPGTMIT
ncbi:DUF222 domain-containing protein [Arthrobacter sp. A5]|uniref:DUF222 domain-containing protein n=1 Tax=Arthrobacter sp. A5 TaxID=576926 RepID=UPI003DAA22E8